MAKQFDNESALHKEMQIDLANAVKYVVDKIYHENQNAVNEVIYGKYVPEYYENTYELQNAWDTEVSMGEGHDATGEFKYAPDKLSARKADSSPNHLGQHSGFSDQDVRTYLADIVYEGLAGHGKIHHKPHAEWTKKRNAFNRLVQIIGKNRLRQWMREGMQKQGLNVKVHNVGIKREPIQ